MKRTFPKIQGIDYTDELAVLKHYMNTLRGIEIKKCIHCKTYMLTDIKEKDDIHCVRCIHKERPLEKEKL